ncbi:MAG: pyridoxal phosphate-dependent aminotransferase [Candidatus Omnitrophica bacterium]|nr:pyridoxal phosphate-dependent aminotransferase [Candidatus Omnitrophota bacterium]
MLLFSAMKPFAKRTQWEMAANPLSRAVEEYKKSGKPFFDLTQSNPTRCEFEYLKPGLLKPFLNAANLSYDPDPHGLVGAREAIAAYYAKKGITVLPHQIFLTANTSEAYSFIFKLLSNPQDCILAPRPSYPLLDYLAGLNDVEIVRYPLFYENSWKINFEDWKKLGAENPKAVMLIHPNNPTGNYVTSPELQKIREFCRTSGAALICDEVFFDFSFGEGKDKAPSFAGEKEQLTFTLSGISKILGLPQMKLSWIVVSGPEGLAREAISRLQIISDTYLSASTPSQNALEEWFGYAEPIQREIRERVLENRNYLSQKISGIQNAKLLEASGGWYAMIKTSLADDEEFVLELIREAGVLIHPGYLYEAGEENLLVLSLIVAPDIFREGISRMAGFLSRQSFHK